MGERDGNKCESSKLHPQNGDVLVFKFDRVFNEKGMARSIQATLEAMYPDEKKRPRIGIVLLRPDETVESLDEKAMFKHGWIRDPGLKCWECHGTGRVQVGPSHESNHMAACEKCGGTGRRNRATT